MADEEIEVEAAPAPTGGGLVKKLIMAGAVAVLIGVGAVVGPMFLGGESASGDAETDLAMADTAPVDGPALYQSLLPPLVINISDSDGEPHFMQLSMEAMARDQNVVNSIREHTAVIRNNLILLYGNATYESVTTREGKEKLLRDGLAEIQKVVQPYVGNRKVEALYFTALVVQ